MGAAWNSRPGRSAKDWITKNRRLALYRRDGHACVYCTSRAQALSLDHLKPRNKGGGNESTNLVTACIPCNSRRKHSGVRTFCILIAAETNQDWRDVMRRVKNQARKKTDANQRTDTGTEAAQGPVSERAHRSDPEEGQDDRKDRVA